MLKEIKIDKGQSFIDKYCKFDDKGFALLSSEAIDKRVKFDGIMVLLTDVVKDPKEALLNYERRNTIEQNFQVFKDSLNFNRVYSSDRQSFNGKFLMQFIASSLVIMLNSRIKNYEHSTEAQKDKIRLTNSSLSRLLDELQTIMLTVYKGGYFFDVINGKFKTLFTAIGIEIPDSSHKYTDEICNQANIEDEVDDSCGDSAAFFGLNEEI
jgi:hypothetical protein